MDPLTLALVVAVRAVKVPLTGVDTGGDDHGVEGLVAGIGAGYGAGVDLALEERTDVIVGETGDGSEVVMTVDPRTEPRPIPRYCASPLRYELASTVCTAVVIRSGAGAAGGVCVQALPQ